jgi:hypothetical protein
MPEVGGDKWSTTTNCSMSAMLIRRKESQRHYFESETAGDGEHPRQSHLSIEFSSKLNNRNTTRSTQQDCIVLPRPECFRVAPWFVAGEQDCTCKCQMRRVDLRMRWKAAAPRLGYQPNTNHNSRHRLRLRLQRPCSVGGDG